MRQDLKDSRNQKIGSIDSQLNGRSTIYNKVGSKIGELRPNGHRLEAFDKVGRKIAYWDENTDTTFEPNGRKIGKGNMLVGLFFQG
ncbi:hypothetical protein SAMN02910370_02064 [Lachnospiraceae bacterium XPB1003]|nr:hypothetical protein SAMN02910370_02064 [Lachnospiraceae bacterium XPB1003]